MWQTPWHDRQLIRPSKIWNRCQFNSVTAMATTTLGTITPSQACTISTTTIRNNEDLIDFNKSCKTLIGDLLFIADPSPSLTYYEGDNYELYMSNLEVLEGSLIIENDGNNPNVPAFSLYMNALKSITNSFNMSNSHCSSLIMNNISSIHDVNWHNTQLQTVYQGSVVRSGLNINATSINITNTSLDLANIESVRGLSFLQFAANQTGVLIDGQGTIYLPGSISSMIIDYPAPILLSPPVNVDYASFSGVTDLDISTMQSVSVLDVFNTNINTFSTPSLTRFDLLNISNNPQLTSIHLNLKGFLYAGGEILGNNLFIANNPQLEVLSLTDIGHNRTFNSSALYGNIVINGDLSIIGNEKLVISTLVFDSVPFHLLCSRLMLIYFRWSIVPDDSVLVVFGNFNYIGPSFDCHNVKQNNFQPVDDSGHGNGEPTGLINVNGTVTCIITKNTTALVSSSSVTSIGTRTSSTTSTFTSSLTTATHTSNPTKSKAVIAGVSIGSILGFSFIAVTILGIWRKKSRKPMPLLPPEMDATKSHIHELHANKQFVELAANDTLVELMGDRPPVVELPSHRLSSGDEQHI